MFPVSQHCAIASDADPTINISPTPAYRQLQNRNM